ncbi:MarR family transcriptional regulator [Saccharothrix deserti]|uniref:MarR family transcriptional regulator n=1 Tax=Saccharothrix deserti TaxID=2593674 RepID=UPI001EE433AD|nr:MarR family transcriptional regulator [Saccharothrix deserti]
MSTTTTRTLRSVPDPAKPRTDTEEKLWQALRDNPGSTAAALSTAAGIGKSTAPKLLTRWEKDGLVTRTTGIADGGSRPADRWSITTDDQPTDDQPTDDQPTDDQPTDDQPTDDQPTDDQPTDDQPTDDQPTDDQPTDDQPTDDQPTDDQPTDDQPTDDQPTDDQPEVAGESGADGGQQEKPERLAPGALRGMVEDYLRDNSGEFSPNTIGKALNRSSGAVHNALEKLVESGYAVRTSDKPKKYSLAPTATESADTSTK